MEIIRGWHNIRPHHKGCVATIGNFDGVHRGHQVLLDHLKAQGKKLGQPSLLITFEPLPREYFNQSRPARLTRFREKIHILRELGIDRVLCIPFNERTRTIPAREVIEDVLVEGLGIQYIVTGDDFRFGKDRDGDFEMLKAAGEKYGFGASHINTQMVAVERVSSTRIRETLEKGDLALAEELLGRPYFIMGRVVYGRQLGRTLGVPTANIRLQRYRSALEGVFAVTVEIEGSDEVRHGVANIGIRPTVDGKEPLLEAHIFDFEGDIYGELLKVTVVKKIREERKFPGLDELKAEIERDIGKTRAFFSSTP